MISNGHSGIDYRVATLSKLSLTVIGIIKQRLKTKRAFGRTEPNYRKASLLKILNLRKILYCHYKLCRSKLQNTFLIIIKNKHIH